MLYLFCIQIKSSTKNYVFDLMSATFHGHINVHGHTNVPKHTNTTKTYCVGIFFKPLAPWFQSLGRTLLQEVILHFTPLCSLLHMLLKDK